jgi:hypothetical protein
VSYCTERMVKERSFQIMAEKSFVNRAMKEKCAEED